ncbi:hypothetical protein J3A64_001648 [Pseudarthrobacter sp. PvP004]|uniref:hypothetical protein n=1 Tax=Pseudarthrobacter sp. PvP004 TaxID=2817850 RepID=UPI001AE6A6CD|nr:hypothetical protein [Pseudarthrobacter sp. PvP004]MBP2266184.1 hypothetical protein [Pseudarthrobacter sp. PvP004]
MPDVKQKLRALDEKGLFKLDPTCYFVNGSNFYGLDHKEKVWPMLPGNGGRSSPIKIKFLTINESEKRCFVALNMPAVL